MNFTNWILEPTISSIATFIGYKDDDLFGEQGWIKNHGNPYFSIVMVKYILICSKFEFNAIPADYEASVTCVADFIGGEEDS